MRDDCEEIRYNDTQLPYRRFSDASERRDYYGSSVRRTLTTRSHDFYGNAITKQEFGNVPAGGAGFSTERRKTDTSYAYNTTSFIVSRPSEQTTYDYAGGAWSQLAAGRFFYDGAAAHTTAPTKGNLTRRAQWLRSSGGDTWPARTYIYDSRGNVVSETSEIGATKNFTYNAEGLLITNWSNALGQATWYSLDSQCGKPTSESLPDGGWHSASYDSHCRLVYREKIGGERQWWTYEWTGAPFQYTSTWKNTASTNASGQPTTDGSGVLTYLDGFGRALANVSGPLPGNLWNFERIRWNQRGTLAGKSELRASAWELAPESSFIWTQFNRDSLDRVIQTILPDGASRTTNYEGSAFGHTAERTVDELGRPEVQHKDGHGRVTSVERWLGTTSVRTQFRFDALDRLIGITDPGGSVFSYTFDTMSRRTQVNDPDLGIWNFEYDAASRLTRQIDAENTRIEYTYDLLDRVKLKTAAAGTAWAQLTAYIYDEARPGTYNFGKLTTSCSGTGVTTNPTTGCNSPEFRIRHDYDGNRRKFRDTYRIDGNDNVLTQNLGPWGEVLWKTYQDGDAVGSVASPWRYDAAGRLNSVPGIINSTTYNNRGQVLTIAYANGVTTTYTYNDARQWLMSVVTRQGATTLSSYTYARDALGRITSVSSPNAGEGWSYSYDSLDRLTQATNATNTALSQSFTYAINGNLLSATGVGTYTYPAATAARPHAVTAIGGQAILYSPNGNMVSGRGRTLEWDAENRPWRITNTASGQKVYFSYWPDGSRARKSMEAANGTWQGQAIYMGPDVEWSFQPSVNAYTLVKYVTPEAKRVGWGTAAPPSSIIVIT